jgi:hypothetical protein
MGTDHFRARFIFATAFYVSLADSAVNPVRRVSLGGWGFSPNINQTVKERL